MKFKKALGVFISTVFVALIIFALLVILKVVKIYDNKVEGQIFFIEKEISINPKEQYQLNIEFESEGVMPQVVYESSNPSIVEVNELTGYIKAKKYGEATITVKNKENEEYTDSCVINVTNVKRAKAIVTSTKSVNVGTTQKKIVDVKSANESDDSKLLLTWKSVDEKVAKVNSDGEIEGVSEGSTKIIVEDAGGAKTTIDVVVEHVEKEIKLESIKISNKIIELEVDETSKTSVIFTPSDATNKNVKWSSNNTSIAVVTTSGIIKAVSEGNAIVTVTSEDGKFKDTLNVIVKKSDKKEEIDNKELINISAAMISNIKDMKYTGSAIIQEPVVKIGTVTLVDNIDYTYITKDNVNVGVTTLTITGKGNYTGSKVITFNILKADDIIKITPQTASYTGSGISATATAKSGSNVTLTYYSDSSCSTKTTTTNATTVGGTPKTSGTYYVIAKSVGNGNYNGSSSSCTKAVEINKITASITCSNKTYTGNAQVIATCTGGTISNATQTNAGNYTISCKADSNHTDALSKTCSISKINDTITITANTKEYTGSGISATASAKSKSTVTLTYYSDSSCKTKTTTTNATTVGGAPKAIGTYYAIGTTAGSTNYNAGKSSCTKSVVINKKTVQIKVGTLNMGAFKCGSSKISCSPTWQNFRDVFKSTGVDIVGIQEGSPGASSTSYSGREAGLKNVYTEAPAARLAIMSKYAFTSKSYNILTSCGEKRGVIKTVIQVNGINISFYDSHLGLSTCNATHFSDLANIVKKDPNPVIIVADYNSTTITNFKTYFSPIGGEIVAYDTTSNNMWGRASYCDSIVIISKGHINAVSKSVYETYKKYSDHNMVIATLNIY